MNTYTITFDGSLEVKANTDQEALEIADSVCAIMPHQSEYDYCIDNIQIVDVQEED